jgi:opacity protein-like surface antigen
MSHRISLTVVALLAAAPAFAGGFAQPVITPPPAQPVIVPPVVASTDWSGAYVGGQLGYGRLVLEDTSDSDLEDDVNSGALYGLHAGYMFDLGRVVLGAEVDFDGTQIESSYYDLLTDDEALSVGSVVRGKLRLGYDAGRVLPYLTAGVAQLRLNSDDELTDADLADSPNGRFVGLGLSFMASDRLMVGVEGLRHQFDDAPFATGEFADTDDTTLNTVTLRGSLRF